MAMELDNSFTVPVPPDQAWDVLLDVKRIAPCMPGATVDEVDGDVVNGRIKVKVGPVSLTYRGTAKFVERDSDAHHVVLEASGKETRGAGTASATVRASLAPDASGGGTQVTMHTTMNVTGRPAQFGRGVMVEVGGKLVEQFAANLAQLIAGDSPADSGAGGGPDAPAGAVAEAAGTSVDGVSGPAATTDAPGGNGISSGAAATAAAPMASATMVPVTSAPPQDDSLNLVTLVGPAILKRVVPVIVGVAGLALLSRLLRRRRRGAEQAGEP
jgi:carbon monoxide dehydrogenase subunit G